ncbi:MAG: hypothetical protein ACI934_001923, partial [Pseudohongiellaceae bacterium]
SISAANQQATFYKCRLLVLKRAPNVSALA